MLSRSLDIIVFGLFLFVTIENFLQGDYWFGSFGAIILIGRVCIEYLAREQKRESNHKFLQILAIVVFVLGYVFHVAIGFGFVFVLLIIALLLDRVLIVNISK